MNEELMNTAVEATDLAEVSTGKGEKALAVVIVTTILGAGYAAGKGIEKLVKKIKTKKADKKADQEAADEVEVEDLDETEE